jgi:membrane-associated phospholipid phosphatase
VSAADLDRSLLRALRTRGHSRRLERAIGLFSRTGEHAACWFALGGVGAALAGDDEQRRVTWLRGLRIVAAAYGVNYAIKLAVRRPRPVLPDLPPLTPTVSRLSFPSAHATSSFAAARAYSPVLPAPLLYAVASAFAVSRPYLGVHYPSDVAAGALFGTLVAGAWR